MKIGYPCINTELCTTSKTFRLASYSDERFLSTVESNLNCLQHILQWNSENDMFFFRISSGIVPFASHPVCTLDWQNIFAKQFRNIGQFIQQKKMRIAMHPDQFVLINSESQEIFQRSVSELVYHAEVLDLMQLNKTHKLQIHVGGVYNDKEKSIARFITRFALLPNSVKARLVIENDDRLYSLKDCLAISKDTAVPILFDTFHHLLYNNNEALYEAMDKAFFTWKEKDGVPMIDYNSQEQGMRIGKHAQTIDSKDFHAFLSGLKRYDFDVMLEIKDKQASAYKALSCLRVLEK